MKAILIVVTVFANTHSKTQKYKHIDSAMHVVTVFANTHSKTQSIYRI